MIELSRHIEYLMLKHDCVIVPGLGGFVTQYVPARRVVEEQLFLPPYRSVGFNRQLTLNDGLLVQSYMQAYDTNYPETIKLIDDAVRRLKETLQEEGEYELSGIGKLMLGVDGQYNFEPCDAGVLSPDLYGLDAFILTECNADKAESSHTKSAEKKAPKKKVQIKRTERNYTISLNREMVNYVAAAVVAVFFYFLWATPVDNNPANNQQVASAIYQQIFDQPAAKQANQSVAATPMADVASSTTDLQPTAQATEVPSPTDKQSATPAPQPSAEPAATETKPFTLVLASAISQHNAEKYAKSLQDDGYNEAKAFKRGKMVRVIYGSYASEAEAQQALTQLQKVKDFADAWILEVK